MKSYRAGFSGKNPVFRKIPDKWSNSRFLSIFSTLKFFKFFHIVNLDNLNCFLSFAKNRRSKKNLFRGLTTVHMQKNDFLSIFSTLKFFNFFLYCKFSQFKLFSIICKKSQVQKKIYFAFWRPSICEKWHFCPFFSTLKFFKFFYIVNLDNSNFFFGPAGGVRHRKNFSAPF